MKSISDLVANDMQKILNSEEHARLFKKPYVKTAAETCPSCNEIKDQCHCGDSMMVDDVVMADDSEHDTEHDTEPSSVSVTVDFEGHSHAEDTEEDTSKTATAINSALKDLLTASAALDYAGLEKASELTLKIATLVSEAKKGKVDMKSTTSGSTKSTSSGSASAKKPAKKMTDKERMAMLRAKAKAKAKAKQKAKAKAKK